MFTGRVYERRKPQKVNLANNIKSFYNERKNISEYLNDDGVGDLVKKKTEFKRSKSSTTLLIFIIVFVGIISQYWEPNVMLTKIDLIIRNTKPSFISYLGMDSTPVNEECCHRTKHLALALNQAEQALRALRHRKTILTFKNIYTEFVQQQTETGHVEGALAMAGTNTTVWGGNIAMWGILPIWRSAPPPNTVLKHRKPTPSDCWPFRGSYGEIIIDLQKSLAIVKISIEHVRPDTTFSAPKHFIVFGILGDGTWMKAAYGIYEYNKPAKQYFNLDNRNVAFQQIVFRVLSNQGNMKYTCLYRISLYANRYKQFANKPV